MVNIIKLIKTKALKYKERNRLNINAIKTIIG